MAIPTAAAILLKALPQVTNVARVYINRPMKDQYVQDTSYLNNYMDYLKGKKSERQVERMLMEPGLREIGREAGRIQRQNEFFASKYGYTGSGIDAQMRLSEQQNRLAAIGALSEKAGLAQAQENLRLDDRIAQLELEKERIKTQGEQSYKVAKKQWQKNLLGSLIGATASVGADLLSNKINKEQSSAFLNTAEKIATGEITKVEDIDKSQYGAKQYEELAKMVVNREGAEFQRGEQILNKIESEFNPSESDMDAIIKSLPEKDRTDPDKIYGATKAYFTEKDVMQTSDALGIPVPTGIRSNKSAANAYIQTVLSERRNAESPAVRSMWDDYYNGTTVEALQDKYSGIIKTKQERTQFNAVLNAARKRQKEIERTQQQAAEDFKKMQIADKDRVRLAAELGKVEFEDATSGSVYRDKILEIMNGGLGEMNSRFTELIDLVEQMSKTIKTNVSENGKILTMPTADGKGVMTFDLSALSGKDIESKITEARRKWYEKTMDTIQKATNSYLKYDNPLINSSSNIQNQSGGKKKIQGW